MQIRDTFRSELPSLVYFIVPPLSAAVPRFLSKSFPLHRRTLCCYQMHFLSFMHSSFPSMLTSCHHENYTHALTPCQCVFEEKFHVLVLQKLQKRKKPGHESHKRAGHFQAAFWNADSCNPDPSEDIGHEKTPEMLIFRGFCMFVGLDQRLLNCGARRAALRPYFFLSFIRGSRVRKPAFFRGLR